MTVLHARRRHSQWSNRPRCAECGKRVAWEFSPKMRSRSKIAIRCLWCMRVMCVRCARKHFLHIGRSQEAVDKILVRAATTALKKIEDATNGRACSVGRVRT